MVEVCLQVLLPKGSPQKAGADEALQASQSHEFEHTAKRRELGPPQPSGNP